MAKEEYSDSDIKMLVDNSVALQKGVTEMALSMNKLTKELSQLVELFKEASKSIASEKLDETVKKEELSSIKGKMDELLDQNKTIAKGIILLEGATKPKENHYDHYNKF